MSVSGETTKKNCLLVFRNKKVNSFDEAQTVIDSFGGASHYFDKISYIAYDCNDTIVKSVKDCRSDYDNAVVLCPKVMEEVLKDFISRLYGAAFDDFGRLSADGKDVFMLFSDVGNRLRVSDICATLDGKRGIKFDKTFIKTVGAPAEVISGAISKARKICGDIDFSVSGEFGDCTVEIKYPQTTPKGLFDEAYRTCLSELNEFVYALEDITLAEQLFRLLKLRRMKLSVAESFTGGGITRRLVQVSGMSEVLFEGLNTYSNEAKMSRLGVKEMTLLQYGAVSEETAYEMAEGLLKTGDCDISIATTGIAGPKSDNSLKPVGLIYIAVGQEENISVFKYNLTGGREAITQTAINLALFLAYKTLK